MCTVAYTIKEEHEVPDSERPHAHMTDEVAEENGKPRVKPTDLAPIKSVEQEESGQEQEQTENDANRSKCCSQICKNVIKFGKKVKKIQK